MGDFGPVSLPPSSNDEGSFKRNPLSGVPKTEAVAEARADPTPH